MFLALYMQSMVKLVSNVHCSILTAGSTSLECYRDDYLMILINTGEHNVQPDILLL